MKKMYLLFLMISFGAILYGQTAKEGKMPITTKAESARALFEQAEKAYFDVNIKLSNDLFLKAKKEDPDMFMADFYIAYIPFSNGDYDGFKKNAAIAINNKSALNEGETLYKEVLKRLIEDKKSDLTDLNKKMITLYPGDQRGYISLTFSLYARNDYNGALDNLTKALEIADNKAFIYNLLGYTYMGLNRMDEAKKAFEKYIELAPELANPYDSMGDYYFQMKDYKKAWKYFSKSADMGLDISKSKAEKAKHLADSLGVK